MCEGRSKPSKPHLDFRFVAHLSHFLDLTCTKINTDI